MSKIELRLSDVEPPEPEPKRTIYRDIANLPDPTKLGLTVRYFNHDDVDLYFQITGEADGYTFKTVNLGLLASGANAFKNLDEFASRAKPSESELTEGEMEETIKLILKAYTDSGYTNLKWTYERTVTVHWINSLDPAFTVDVLNNFDDGTVQGWACSEISYGNPICEVRTDYVLSAPYSLRGGNDDNYSFGSGAEAKQECRLYKSFTTPNKDKVFAIFDLRIHGEVTSGSGGTWAKRIKILRDTVLLVQLGRYNTIHENDLPDDRWMRVVVPLPKNTSLTLKIEYARHVYSTETYSSFESYLWLDDFKLISK